MLVDLQIHENAITELDVSKLLNLGFLVCALNDLSVGALRQIINDLPMRGVDDNSGLMLCTDNPGFSQLTQADIELAMLKNWTVQ